MLTVGRMVSWVWTLTWSAWKEEIFGFIVHIHVGYIVHTEISVNQIFCEPGKYDTQSEEEIFCTITRSEIKFKQICANCHWPILSYKKVCTIINMSLCTSLSTEITTGQLSFDSTVVGWRVVHLIVIFANSISDYLSVREESLAFRVLMSFVPYFGWSMEKT